MVFISHVDRLPSKTLQDLQNTIHIISLPFVALREAIQLISSNFNAREIGTCSYGSSVGHFDQDSESALDLLLIGLLQRDVDIQQYVEGSVDCYVKWRGKKISAISLFVASVLL